MVAIKSEVKKSWPVFMMTVYIDLEGDKKMLERAVEGAKRRTEEVGRDRPPYIVGVTVLTSSDYSENTSTIVLEKAKLAKEAGLDGVVCSAHEAAVVREACGRDFIIVTPGIRPKGYKADDQKRTATAQEAINAGANYIVVGRPILEAKDPLKAIDGLL
jgi:orotidine-5'-phosphate decarboxylase